MAEHIASNVRELEGALVRLAAHHSLVGRPLDLDCVRRLLKDVLAPPARSVSIEDIERKVCAYFHVRVTDLHSAKRARNISRPRQVAMFLAKQLTSTSLPAIGRYFGGRDHTTVMHAITAIDGLMARDVAIKEAVTLLRQSLESSA
jgi:chromosomal replication initiator protein